MGVGDQIKEESGTGSQVVCMFMCEASAYMRPSAELPKA